MQAVDRVRVNEEISRLKEFEQRTRFRLWKVGSHDKEKALSNQEWHGIVVFVSTLIFDCAEPKPVGLYMEWMPDEEGEGNAYYAESWIRSFGWKKTSPYGVFWELIRKATDINATDENKLQAWEELQKTADIITTYAVPPEDSPFRQTYLDAAKAHFEEWRKDSLAIRNLNEIAEFIRQFKRLPTNEEMPLNE